jgi:HEAT repeat protein
MKRSALVIVILMLAVSLTAVANEGVEKSNAQPAFKKEAVEANLLTGVQSANFGLRTSAAAMLGDLKSSQAVIPLMRMLRTESDERARVVAALALYKIGDPVGIYAVKMTGVLDDNARVRKLCALFYSAFEQNHI